MSARLFVSFTMLLVLLQGCRPQVAPAPAPASDPEPVRTEGVRTESFERLVTPCRNSVKEPSQTAPDLDCSAPPATFNSNLYLSSTDPAMKAQAGPAFDSWAWSSFAAFN